jgi:hypothetical protein
MTKTDGKSDDNPETINLPYMTTHMKNLIDMQILPQMISQMTIHMKSHMTTLNIRASVESR